MSSFSLIGEKLSAFTVFFCIISLTSCYDFPIVSDSKAIDSEGWYSEDSVSFEWEVDNLDMRYNAFIDIRHTGQYSFSNLYLITNLTFPNGKQKRDTIHVTLADDRGNWFGSGLGDLVDHRIAFIENKEFPIKGTYKLKIAQGMRQDPLKAITDVGFRLEKSK